MIWFISEFLFVGWFSWLPAVSLKNRLGKTQTVVPSSKRNYRMFAEKINNGISGALLYGITPPKDKTEKDKLLVITEKRTNRVNQLNCDGLIVYDIQDESNRTDEIRPFEYFPTLEPLDYTNRYHGDINCQKIIYHVVGKYTPGELHHRLVDCDVKNYLSVFVGAASKNQPIHTKLDDAYKTWSTLPNKKGIGGVVIPERHNSKQDEHLRIIEKQNKGCSFFISQCVCNIEMVKNFISDYCFAVEDRGLPKKYFVFTLTICGTIETLRLMNWLGVDVPRWLKNDLIRSKNIIEESIVQNIRLAKELYEYCGEKKINCGFNVESISPKKSEVDATVILFNELRKNLKLDSSSRPYETFGSKI